MSKLQFKLSAVKYMGNIVTSSGLKPCPEKTAAIYNMPAPEDKTALQRLLGMIRYLAQFIPNESSLTAPLRNLLKKDAPWHWEHEHEAALNQLKEALMQPTVLAYYDVKKPVLIQTDASQYGLGSCLLQEGRPIAYASRALTSAETNYSQIEKELLAICFACSKFHHYTYGQDVEVHTDHRPLEIIFKKPLGKAAPRLQRMLLQLQRYSLDVKFVPGKLMYVADTLSRAFVPGDPKHGAAEDIEVMVHSLARSLPISDDKRALFTKTTLEDPNMQQLHDVIQQGWPNSIKGVQAQLRPYWNVRDELHIAEDLIFRGQQLVVPTQLRPYMLSLIHESHLGTEKCKTRARQVVYWPKMSTDIENTVGECEICQSMRASQQKEPLIPHELPIRPWQKLAADIMTISSVDYLVVVDYFSKYPEIAKLEKKTAQTVIVHLKSIMARHGIPEQLCSDNMPFASAEFRRFAQEWDIKLITSSPTYAQSNSQGERAVQTVKRLITKAQKDRKDPYIALLEYRNAPVSGTQYSPAQMLMSRMLRDRLPASSAQLMPAIVDARLQLEQKQQQEKRQYDMDAKEMPPLSPGDSVRVQKGRTWVPAQVIRVDDTNPRSYIVSCNGSHLRRNRRHLLYTPRIPPPRAYDPVLFDDDDHEEAEAPPVIPQGPPQPDRPPNAVAPAPAPAPAPAVRPRRPAQRPKRFDVYEMDY